MDPTAIRTHCLSTTTPIRNTTTPWTDVNLLPKNLRIGLQFTLHELPKRRSLNEERERGKGKERENEKEREERRTGGCSRNPAKIGSKTLQIYCGGIHVTMLE